MNMSEIAEENDAATFNNLVYDSINYHSNEKDELIGRMNQGSRQLIERR